MTAIADDTTPASVDVAVVGAGVIGCAIARTLTRFDLDVCLVDREADVGFGTSKANSGIIHAGHHSPTGTLKGALEWTGNQQWGPLADELNISFERVGDLTVAFDDEQVGTLERLAEQAVERDVPGVEIWDGPRLRQEEPNLSPALVAGLFAPSTGVINPYEACFALAEDAVANGLTLRLDAPVQAIDVTEDGLVLDLPDGEVRSRIVINAAGLGAAQVEAMVGLHTFDLIARKGEEYLLDKRLEGLVRRIIFPCPTPTSKGTLVIPTYDGTIMIGPTAIDVDDPDDLTTTSTGAAIVLKAVQRLVPGISAGDCIAEFAGVRAVATTGDFVIGPTDVPGFLNVAGIQSPGLTAAPAIADLVTRLVADQGLTLTPSDPIVAPARRPDPIRDLDWVTRAERATADPAFGRVVCRCELVTEGEVTDAIGRGATTLDGVKFRTRAGMGRCQGGFCTWRVMEALSAELGRPTSALTKRGGDSWLVLERDDPTPDGTPP